MSGCALDVRIDAKNRSATTVLRPLSARASNMSVRLFYVFRRALSTSIQIESSVHTRRRCRGACTTLFFMADQPGAAVLEIDGRGSRRTGVAIEVRNIRRR